MQKHALKFKILFLLVLFLLGVFVWMRVFSAKEESVLEVAFLDVGQGDAIFVEAPNGNQMLIDGGRGKEVLRELGNEMSFFDRHIDVILATHPDADHLGGLLSVVERYDTGLVFTSGAAADGELDENFSNTLAQKNIQEVQAKRETIIDLGGGVIFEVLYPNEIDTSEMEPNASSVVGKLTYGETSFLFMGDAPSDVEKYLAFEYGKKLEADILKVGHHGSDTSTSEIFLSAVNPKRAVISVGEENRYGHPDKIVLERILASGSEIFQTSKTGRVLFESDGENVKRTR